ncbi:hypothetical protein Hanom_Chr15g01384221 [Helianthus anomalus]
MDGGNKPDENGKISTFWIHMWKNKPLNESRKTGQPQGRKWHFTLNLITI